MSKGAKREEIAANVVADAKFLLEAEVAPKAQQEFQARYKRATGVAVSPGAPEHYQHQENKWGAELRGYFNDPETADWLEEQGVRVEHREKGYRSGDFPYRFSDNEFWWTLIEQYGLELGPN